jgi:hypothetical protein
MAFFAFAGRCPLACSRESYLCGVGVARLLLKPVDTHADESRCAVHFNIESGLAQEREHVLSFSVFIFTP